VYLEKINHRRVKRPFYSAGGRGNPKICDEPSAE